MTPFTSVHLANAGMRAERLTVTSRSGLGWLSRVLLLSLSCFVANCTDSSPSSSPNGVGGANASTGGAKGSDASASGGADKDSTSTQKSASGGSSVENESGGAPSSSSAASAVKGGAGGNKSNAPSGGTATSGDANGSGGAAVTGGASNETQPNKGGAAAGGKSSKNTTANNVGGASTGGKSGSGGATATGGKSGVPTGGATGTGGATASGTFTLTSPGWTAMAGCGPDAKTSCPPLPTEITRSGAGTSPELHWSGAPEGTKSFVVVLQDLNNKTAHWILWNIPASVTSLAANVDRSTATPAVPAGSQQCGKGTEAATSDGYYGPGAPCNVYEFLVYALSVEKFSPTSATDQESVRTQLQALGSSILGTASLRGRTNTGC